MIIISFSAKLIFFCLCFKIIKMNSAAIESIPPIFICHGGGPLPILNDPSHQEMLKSFKILKNLIPKPKEILVVSAHWEEKEFTVLTNPNPSLLYDYYGFPEKSYNLNYPIKLAKDLNKKIFKIFDENKINYKEDSERDYDHGVFVPLILLFPNLDVPVTQISLKSNLNPKEHINLGRVLSKLSEEGVLILGSGLTFHNIKGMLAKPNSSELQKSHNFHNYLKEIFNKENDFTLQKRFELLEKWENANGARYSHPREEHLIPLFVAAGASKFGYGLILEYELMNNKVFDVIFENKDNKEIAEDEL